MVIRFIITPVVKVSMDVMKPWIAKRITEMLGFEDDIVVEPGSADGSVFHGYLKWEWIIDPNQTGHATKLVAANTWSSNVEVMKTWEDHHRQGMNVKEHFM